MRAGEDAAAAGEPIGRPAEPPAATPDDRPGALELDLAGEVMARMLTEIAGVKVTPVLGGYRVKTTDTAWIDVLRMLFNWRVARTPRNDPWSYDRHWCFAGTGWDAMLTAVLAAVEWDGGDDTEPAGWNKSGQTGEWRPPPDGRR